MELTGKQKAAMLLMSLDAATAGELVKGLDDEVVRELAVELAYLDAADIKTNNNSNKIVRQFHHSLRVRETFQLNGFLDEVLKSSVGQEKAAQIQAGIQQIMSNPDPFGPIRSADSRTLASVLANERPQTTAVILSELPTEKMLEVLNFLDGGSMISVAGRMSSCKKMPVETKAIITEAVCERLEAVTGGSAEKSLPSWSQQSLRNIAVIVKGLDKEIRDGLLNAIFGEDRRAVEMVMELMVIWTDIPNVTDRSLQKVLEGIDAKTLALALYEADDAIINKIKSNLSEQTIKAMYEQVLLISAPTDGDIDDAIDRILRILREMNEKGELVFMSSGCDV